MEKFSVVFFTLVLLTFAIVGFATGTKHNKELVPVDPPIQVKAASNDLSNEVVVAKSSALLDGEGLVYNFHGDYVSTLVELHGH